MAERHAERLADAGVDAEVAVAAEAGCGYPTFAGVARWKSVSASVGSPHGLG